MARTELKPNEWMEFPILARQMHAQMSHEGILIASLDAAGRLNPMTIGWGVFGWIWNRPIFTILVRPSRYTYDCIEATGDFTVNVQPADRRDIVDFCGTISGRDHDKMSELELTSLPSTHISSPGIAECPIIFECNVVHLTDVVPPELPESIKSEYYPQGDFHRIYFGQVLNVSVEKSFLEES
ncbi:MAG: flavin reductase family protein [Phycisphaerales bacterium]|nr:MAG: flavin reductase family protein [Phycisphaerales bacterium]